MAGYEFDSIPARTFLGLAENHKLGILGLKELCRTQLTDLEGLLRRLPQDVEDLGTHPAASQYRKKRSLLKTRWARLESFLSQDGRKDIAPGCQYCSDVHAEFRMITYLQPQD